MEEFKFKKKFGQNFISDKNLLSAIVSDAEVNKNDNVLEIGAGAGSLTQELSSRAKKVVSFEIDNDLKEILTNLGLKNVDFVFSDFMKVDFADVKKMFDGKFKVVANLPYYITTPILFKLLENADSNISDITIMVQKEVAERICADCGGKDYGILTVMVKFFGEPKILRIIKRQMFFPMPNVDSALLGIKIDRKYKNISHEKFLAFVKTCFSMRRKTLFNNLSAVYKKSVLQEKIPASVLSKRAEALSLDELVEIFKTLS